MFFSMLICSFEVGVLNSVEWICVGGHLAKCIECWNLMEMKHLLLGIEGIEVAYLVVCSIPCSAASYVETPL